MGKATPQIDPFQRQNIWKHPDLRIAKGGNRVGHD
jgi:hypothetical protein